MAEDSGSPSAPSPLADYRTKTENRSALERVSMLVPNLTEETTVAEVADDADVSRETARKHLNHFENWHVLVRTGTNPETFVRNESYFDWLRIDALKREQSVEELQETLSELAAEDERLAEELDGESPASVDMLGEGYENAAESAEKVRRWQSVRDRMDDVVAALRNKLDLDSTVPREDASGERLRISE
ncbi:DUF7342 family protein [Halorussus caseinilyticus]|uniref:ArsR family transcriptional regulator n=1 Tax=Halorussus caseinilyticus TaxID=3034025 RepID=A0ABD5WNC5_9EURY|nr:hypothetical protein [Halorussus sp. DT72]